MSHEDTLAAWAQMAGIDDPPQVDTIRVISQSEWGGVMAECLTEAGFPVTYAPSGGLGMDGLAPDQMSAYDRAMYVCMAQYPVEALNSEALTDDQLEKYHAWLLDNTVTCMRDLGHPVGEPFRGWPEPPAASPAQQPRV